MYAQSVDHVGIEHLLVLVKNNDTCATVKDLLVDNVVAGLASEHQSDAVTYIDIVVVVVMSRKGSYDLIASVREVLRERNVEECEAPLLLTKVSFSKEGINKNSIFGKDFIQRKWST